MKKLSKKKSKEYPRECPNCGGKYIEYRDFETDGETGWLERWCVHCDYTWWDVFTFSHIEELYKGRISKTK